MEAATARVSKKRRALSKIGAFARGAAIAEANRARAERNRRTDRWTASEMRIVMQLYPDYEAIMEKLPRRSIQQLRSFATCYGIAKKRHAWKTTELKELKRMWEAGLPLEEIVAHFGFCTVQQIKGIARHYHYFRPKTPFKKSGHLTIDAIRAKCDEMGYSMVDLDEWCKAKGYWARISCAGKANWKHIHKAVEILGGELTVRWRPLEAA